MSSIQSNMYTVTFDQAELNELAKAFHLDGNVWRVRSQVLVRHLENRRSCYVQVVNGRYFLVPFTPLMQCVDSTVQTNSSSICYHLQAQHWFYLEVATRTSHCTLIRDGRWKSQVWSDPRT